MKKPFRLACLVFVSLVVNGCYELIDDPGFQDWCGEELCSWELSEGEIRRVSTWHPNDYGVELLTAPVVISQLYDQAVSCIRFEVLADVDITAQVSFSADFGDDGEVEFEQMIGASNWAPIQFLVTAPVREGRVRFSIRKDGVGRAVLARLGAEEAFDCPEQTAPSALGVGCDDEFDCASGLCPYRPDELFEDRCGPEPDVSCKFELGPGVCSECYDEDDCAPGEQCVLTDDPDPLLRYYECRSG